MYLRAAAQTLPGDPIHGAFHYTKQVLAGDVAVLEFATTVEGKFVNGVDIIRCDDTGSGGRTLGMPILDAYIPEGALSPSAERSLLAKIADLLLAHEGVDPRNERARPLAWVFVHRPQVYVASVSPKSPRYRFICQVPEGQYDDERRAAVTAAMTQAVAEAEGGAPGRIPSRACASPPARSRTAGGAEREGSSGSRTSTKSPGHSSRALMGSLGRRPTECSQRAADEEAQKLLVSAGD